MRNTITMLLLFVGIFSCAQVYPQSKSVIFKNVNIVDVEQGVVRTNQNVWVEGNRIKSISSKPLKNKGGTIIDASGKYLIPGLWDMHVHVFNNISKRPPEEWYFPHFIANGVTSVRDMWTKPQSMADVRLWRTQLSQNSKIVPRFSAVGTIVDGTPVSWKNSDTAINAAQARAIVQRLKDGGVDFVKVYARLNRETYFAIVAEAKKLRIPFAGHLPNSVSFEEASNAGQKSIEHLGWYKKFIDLSADKETFQKINDTAWTPELRLQLIQSFSEQKWGDLAELFAKNGTWMSPTSVINYSSMLSDDTALQHDARLQLVPSTESEDWLRLSSRANRNTRFIREVRFQKTLDMIRIMHIKGVGLLAGTDLGNPYIYPGSSLHDELGFFVKAGLSPLAALQTATINPAKYADVNKELGTVQEGKLADLVLLDANPLDNISNTRRITAVMINGRIFLRKDLEKMQKQGNNFAASANNQVE